MYVLLLPTVQALSFDSTTDGESFATWSLAAAGCLLLGMLICAWRSQKTETTLAGFTQILLFYQFVRWSALVDLDGSGFFYGYWRRVALLLDPVEILDTPSEAISSQASAMQIPSALLLSNAEEPLAFLVGCMMVCGLIAACFPQYRQQKLHYALLSWSFLAVAGDMSLYIYLQLGDFETGSSLEMASCLVTVALLVGYLLGFVIILSGVSLLGRTRGFITYFVQEFQTNKPAVVYLYYPFLLLSRLMTSLGLAYAGGTLQVSVALATEGAIILYVLLVNPYKQTRNTLLTFLFHLLEGGTFMLPLLYSKDLAAASTLNLFLVLAVWATLALCLIRFVLDFIAESTTEQVNPKPTVVRKAMTEKIEEDIKPSNRSRVGITMLEVPKSFADDESSQSRDELILHEAREKPPVHVPLQFLPDLPSQRPAGRSSAVSQQTQAFPNRPPSLYSNPMSDWGLRAPQMPVSRASRSTASINDVTVVRAFPQNRM